MNNPLLMYATSRTTKIIGSCCLHTQCDNYSRETTIQGRKLLIIRTFCVRQLFKGGNYSRKYGSFKSWGPFSSQEFKQVVSYETNQVRYLNMYRVSPTYAHFGTWKKPCYMKLVLVGLYFGPLLMPKTVVVETVLVIFV